MKLVKNNSYLLLIDEEAEIKEGDTVYRDTGIIFKITNECISYYKEVLPKTVHKIYRCISYYTLTKEAKELDLPLLPNPFKEVDIEEMVNKEASMYVEKYASYKHESYMYNECKRIFKAGYKAAQSKQFSLEDIQNAISFGRGLEINSLKESTKDVETAKFIQSLSTQQLPKEFIVAYERVRDLDNRNINGDYNSKLILKTTTNSEGKEVLVGEYKY